MIRFALLAIALQCSPLAAQSPSHPLDTIGIVGAVVAEMRPLFGAASSRPPIVDTAGNRWNAVLRLILKADRQVMSPVPSRNMDSTAFHMSIGEVETRHDTLFVSALLTRCGMHNVGESSEPILAFVPDGAGWKSISRRPELRGYDIICRHP
jgi:hypothetical protein